MKRHSMHIHTTEKTLARLDEREVAPAATPRRGALLYKKILGFLAILFLATNAAFASDYGVYVYSSSYDVTNSPPGGLFRYALSHDPIYNPENVVLVNVEVSVDKYNKITDQWEPSGFLPLWRQISPDDPKESPAPFQAYTIPSKLKDCYVERKKDDGSRYLVYTNEVTIVAVDGTVGEISANLPWSHCVFENIADITVEEGIERIGDKLFSWCNGIKRITLPSSLKAIDKDAFVYCEGLESVNLEDTQIEKIGESAFAECNALSQAIVLPDTLKVVGDYAFDDSVITSLHFPDSAFTIGYCAFLRCRQLKTIETLGGCTNLGAEAFAACENIECVDIPSTVANIPQWAFRNCGSLRDVTFHEGLKTIGDEAFKGCPIGDLILPDGVLDVKSFPCQGKLVVPPSVTNLFTAAASYCYPKDLTIARFWTSINYHYATNIVLSSGIEELPRGIFANYGSLETVTLPDTLLQIGENAFYNCTNLVSVAIPESTRIISGYAFYNCTRLSSLVLPESMLGIGDFAFQGCKSLSELTIPKSMQSIGQSAFSGCETLERVVFEGDAPPSVNDYAFSYVPSGCTAYVHKRSTGWNVPIPGTWKGLPIKYITEYYRVVFDWNGLDAESSETNIREESPVLDYAPRLPDHEGKIFLGWFTEKEGGEAVTAETAVTGDATYYAHWTQPGVGLTFIDDAGVEWHYQIKGEGGTSEFYVEIVGDGACPVSGGQIIETGAINKGTAGELAIPSHINGYPVRVIGTWAFAYCRQLTEVTIPDTVTIIRDAAFASCSNMKKVNFGANVQTVGPGAFLYCTSLNFVELPRGAELGASAFGGCESLRYLKATGNFSSGDHIVPGYWIGGMMLNLVGGGVDMDPLWDCTAISCIELGEEVTSVKLDGFEKGPNLRNIICRGSLPSIEGINASNGKRICYVLREKYPDGLPSDTWAGMQLKYLEGEVPTDSVAVDFEVRSAALSKEDAGVDSENTFAADDEIVFSYESIERWGVVGVETQIVNRIVVKHLPDGSEIGYYDDVLENCSGNVARKGLSIPVLANLKSGKYELCVELNVNRDVAETYYGNNTTSITFTVAGPPDPVDPFTAAGLAPSYTLQAGAAPDLSKVFAAVAGDGWKIAVAGLPAGLKFAQDKKTGDYALTGVATKEVVGEVTFTATKGTEKETAKSTFEVVYPTLTVVAAAAKDDPSATNGVKVAGGGKYALGAKVTLKATPAKTSVFVGWYLGEELVSQNASYAYVTTDADATFTAKFVTADEDRENVSLAVNGAAVGSVEAPTATNVMCGVALEWPVAAGALSATTVKVAGLPAGLKFTDKPVTAKVGTGKDAVVVTNVPANTIYGAPSAASKTATDRKTGAVTVTPSDVKITVTTAGKSSVTYLVKLTVDPLPAWAVGNFEGVVSDNSMKEFGPAAFSVTAAGKVSGKYTFLGTNWTFKADSFSTVLEASGSRGFYVTANATSGKVVNEVDIVVVKNSDCTILSGSAVSIGAGYVYDDPNRVAQISAYRLPWSDKDDKEASSLLSSYAGAYTSTAAYGDVACPVVFTLDEKGVIKGTAEVPDGAKKRKVSFTSSALPMNDALGLLVVVPADLKKGYPALMCSATIHNFYASPSTGHAYRDPGVVAAVAERTPDSGASGTVAVSPKYGQVAAGKDVSLTAKPSDKHSVFYKWEITGLDTTGLDLSAATLKFKSPGTNDVVATAVFVKDTEDAESIRLVVDSIDLKADSPTRSVFCGVAVNWDVEATALSATTVKATGLPAGLKLVQDKKTKAYAVEGVPTAASKAAKGSSELAPSPVKFTVTTAGKSSKDFTVNLVVLPLPAWAAGTFDGAAYAPGGEPVEGVVQALTIDAKGKIGGKILKNGETWTLSANSFEGVDGLDDPENLAFYATVIGKNGKLLETNEVTVTARSASGPYQSGVVSGWTASVPSVSWTAYQNLWKRADTKADMPVIKKDIKVDLELGEAGDANNKLTLAFKKDGAVSFSGKINGVSVSGSSQLVWVESGHVGRETLPDGWVVTLYAPQKGTFKGYNETIAVTLTLDAQNIVSDVTVEVAETAEP